MMFDSYTVMLDKPEGKTIAGGAIYWVIYIIVFPFILSVLASSGFQLPNVSINSILVFFFYAVNFLAVGAMFRPYLLESFFNVRCYPKRFFSAVAVASGIILFVEYLFVIGSLAFHLDEIYIATDNLLPIIELPLLLSGSLTLLELPVLGILCITVFVPITMCCLYYSVIFAPIAADRPRLAYLAVLLLAALPRLAALGNTGYPLHQLAVYIMQVPWHLCACWAYRKADTIWAPIAVYTVVNLLSGLLLLVVYYLFYHFPVTI